MTLNMRLGLDSLSIFSRHPTVGEARSTCVTTFLLNLVGLADSQNEIRVGFPCYL